MQIEDIFLARVPNAKLRLLVRMAKTLVRDTPADANGPVNQALAKLIEHIKHIDDALSCRLRLNNPHLIARELEFDRAVDSLWIFLREHLALCAQAFGHPGLEQLSDARQAEVDLYELRELATTAASVHEQLFAAEGTNFVKFAFSDQAEAMAAILRVIEQDGLGDGIEQVFDARILAALVVCQQQYEELVSDRMRRDLGVAEDFRALRRRLRWLLARYKTAVETLYDEDEPESGAVVESALRALMMVGAHLKRGSAASFVHELDAELVDDEELGHELEPAVVANADAGDEPPITNANA